MGNISNRFYVTALEDGTTLHGNLVSDKSLVQSWNGNSAVPNWTTASEQPTIHLTLLSGNTQVEPSNTYKWYYNGGEIVFDGNNQSTSANGVPAGVFLKTTVTIGQLSMPALKIIGNLASSNNVDIDTIEFRGQYIINGTGVDFSCNIQVRISTINAAGYLGVINFHNGIGDITSAGQTITLYGVLYGGESGEQVPGFKTKWYLNEEPTGHGGDTYDGHTNAFRVSEADVVDHATVRCEFYDTTETELLYTAYASIDDMQDPEFMYIQYAGNNGNAASLHKNESATFQIWVGTRDDPSVLGGTGNPKFKTIKVKLLDGDGNTITDSGLATNIPDADSNGWRTLPMSGGKGSISPHYDTVAAYGKNITGIVVADTSSQG